VLLNGWQRLYHLPFQFGANPGALDGVPFVGLEKVFPLEIASIDAHELGLTIYTRAIETRGGDPATKC